MYKGHLSTSQLLQYGVQRGSAVGLIYATVVDRLVAWH